MKRKSNIVLKHVRLVLSGVGLICLLNSCTSNQEHADYGNMGSVAEESSVHENEIANENQNSETNTEQPLLQLQISADTNKEPLPASADASRKPLQTSTDTKNEPLQTSADTSGKPSQTSTDTRNEPLQTSADTSWKPSQTSADVSNKQPNSSKENDRIAPLSLEESYKAILLEDGEFISTDLQNTQLNLKTIKKVVTDDDTIRVAATKFSITDLNGDGKAEIIILLQINDISDYGFEILQYQEKGVYGYTLPYRAFLDLKTDGTFTFSDGDTGIGKLRFSENGYTIDKLHYSESNYDSNNELKVAYFVNGETSSEEEFNRTMRQQEEKSNVRWYDLSSDNVNIAFENMS